MLRSHYRQPIDWTLRGLEEAEKALTRFARIAAGAPAAPAPSEALIAALADDLNSPAALAHLHALANDGKAAELRRDAAWLGLDIEAAIAAENAPPEIDADTRERIETLVAERLAARGAKDWAASDRLRDELAGMGVALKDGKDGTSWEIKR